jgi:hypothetical protein
LLRGLNVDPATQDLIRDGFESQTDESLEQVRVLANDDAAPVPPNMKRGLRPSLPLWTRNALIVLSIGIGFVLYPPAFFALLWLYGGLVALSVLIVLAVFVSEQLSKRSSARRK